MNKQKVKRSKGKLHKGKNSPHNKANLFYKKRFQLQE